jgi:hypothetical protein
MTVLIRPVLEACLVTARSASLLATRRGKLLLLLLCAVDIKAAPTGAITARLAATRPLADVLQSH